MIVCFIFLRQQVIDLFQFITLFIVGKVQFA